MFVMILIFAVIIYYILRFLDKYSSVNRPRAASQFSDSDDFGTGRRNLFEGSDSCSPSVNIDGSPMVGGVDIHGKPFGFSSSFDD